ncbi:MAG: lipoprotein signal peptidase [Candidatus Coprenecus sp.]
MAFSKKTRITIISLFAVLLVLADQISKIWVKTNMTIGESISVFGDWFQILFVENPGMAFGMAFGGDIGKYLLTGLRLVLFVIMLLWIRKLTKKEETPMGVLIGLTAIMIGALGNIIDCMFYGEIFSQSTATQVSEFVPLGTGYGSFMLGRVVDMLYFPIVDLVLPDWFPFNAGERFIFFRPIFNIADSCISVGAVYLLIFHWKFISKEMANERKK